MRGIGFAIIALGLTGSLAYAKSDDAWYAVVGHSGECQAMNPDVFMKGLREEGDTTVQSRTLLQDGKVMGVVVRTQTTAQYKGYTGIFLRGLQMCQDMAATIREAK